MKQIKQAVFLIFFLSFIAACKRDGNSDLPVSSGKINEVSVIISDALWSGEVGDSLRKKFAAPVDGLPHEEPLFTISQYAERVFEGRVAKGRNLVIIEKGKPKKFTFKRNKFCSPQNIFTVSGKNIPELLEQIEMHGDEMVRVIKEAEITENQEKNIRGGLLDEKRFSTQYNISIKLPSTYSYAIENDAFLWLKKDIPSGNSSIVIYQVPYAVIEKDKTIIDNIIKMRDSIGSRYIHGQEPGTFMVTEEAYSPYLFTTSFNDKRAFETRGNWEMENDFMSGPFLNYAIKDEKNNRYLVIEGFIYSPSSPKRDLIHELESIIRSVKFL